MTEHVLIWKNTGGVVPRGFNALLSWSSYTRAPGATHFLKRDSNAQIADLVHAAASDAQVRCREITVAWQPEHPETVSAAELETAICKLRPATLICPERKTGGRWIITDFGTPESLPDAAIQAAIRSTVSNLFPRWEYGRQWSATCFRLRHSTNAEQLGLIPPQVPTADDLLALVADDEAVIEANRRSDPAAVGGLRDLVAARIEAQLRHGIAPEHVAPIYSSEVEGHLIPVVMRLGDARDKLGVLCRNMRRLYGDYGDRVLDFALRSFSHEGPGIAALREAAKATAAAAA